MGGRGWLAVLALGLVVLAGCGDTERGNLKIEGDTDTNTGTTGTGTTAFTVDSSLSKSDQLAAAMKRVADYGREQAKDLVAANVRLQTAIGAGSIPQAKSAYAAARPYYERIEPLVAIFPELDRKIDARESNSGFHPIERELWHDGKITAQTKRLAAGLVKDSSRLDTLLDKAKVQPKVVIPGTAELVDEIEESKITGEEERYSKLDLPTFLANLEGSKEFYEAIEDLVKAKDPGLHTQIEEAFDKAFAEVRSVKGRAYDKLSTAQQKQIKQSVEALAEPLARVQGTLGVKS